jgi:alpha-L-rhamnosidase
MTTTYLGRFRVATWRAAVVAAAALSLLPMTGTVAAADVGRGQIRVADLTTEHLIDPLGIDTSSPRLSWIDTSAENGISQTAYEIIVSTREDRSGDVWDSGRVASARSYDVAYSGHPLQSRTRYFWEVRVWDDHGQVSPWSRLARFETAFLNSTEFQGAWIGSANDKAPNPLLRKEFSLHGGITSARAYVTGLGFYQLYLNGRRIGDHVLDPAFTDYTKTVDYVTYDVTRDVGAGRNAVGVSLGNGWYSGFADHFSIPGAVPWQPAQPKLKFDLDVHYADGTSAQVLSDTSWVMADGPTTADNVQSESYDARLVQPGWASPGFDASAWTPAVTTPAPAGTLRAQSIPPIERTALIDPVKQTEPQAGLKLYDFGITTSGWARITLLGAAGTSVSIRYAERLNADGTAEDENDQTDTYVLKGGGPETYEPSWGWKGYRYVQVSANPASAGATPPPLPKVVSIQGVEVHTALASTGDFDSSNNLFNTMHEAMRRTVLNNQYSFGSDTPVYEKAGWTADNRLYSISAMSNFGMEAYYQKWMQDFDDSQYPDGSLPVIVPSPATCTSAPFPICITWHVTEPVWESAVILMHMYLYTYYGDLRSVQRDYGTMAAWLNKVESEISSTGYIYEGFTFGDWVEPTNGVAPSSQLISSMFVYESATELARLAGLIGQTADVSHFQQLADMVKTAIVNSFYDAVGPAFREPGAGYSQTANLLGLAFGIAPAADRQSIVNNLVADVAAKGNHLATGANGSTWILPVLTEAGYGDLAYQIATNPTYPGWGHWFEQCGATTMWEAWECDTARSHDHAFMGTIDNWFFTDLAGIQPTEPAFRSIRIKPYPVGDLTSASAHRTTPLGEVRSAWRRSGRAFSLTVDIPVGSTAQVFVPAAAPSAVQAPAGATFIGTQEGYAAYSVGSGRYTFQSAM